MLDKDQTRISHYKRIRRGQVVRVIHAANDDPLPEVLQSIIHRQRNCTKRQGPQTSKIYSPSCVLYICTRQASALEYLEVKRVRGEPFPCSRRCNRAIIRERVTQRPPLQRHVQTLKHPLIHGAQSRHCLDQLGRNDRILWQVIYFFRDGVVLELQDSDAHIVREAPVIPGCFRPSANIHAPHQQAEIQRVVP